MSAKLVAYEYVPAGFEMVIGNPDVEMGKVWNLWFNVKLTDDPEAWDDKIALVNEMQGRLGALTMDQRLIRAQMAEFCRRAPLFPESIHTLCKEIGDGRFSNPVSMGCEGRALLQTLGYHDPQSLREQRKELFNKYARSLKKWLAQGRPENPTESKVFRFLGEATNGREAFAEKLISAIDAEELSISSLKKLCIAECRKTSGFQAASIEDGYRGWAAAFFPVCCLGCQEGCPEGASIPICQCCDSMVLDAGLLCAGEFGEKMQMAGEFRRVIEEHILVYAVAINSWLEGRSPKQVTWPEKARYIAKNGALEIAERVHFCLGDKDEAKEWLVACLLKTVRDNQRWHKRAELIDDFPEATSWFRERRDIRS